jgi:hypothetical protein
MALVLCVLVKLIFIAVSKEQSNVCGLMLLAAEKLIWALVYRVTSH